MYTYQYIYIYMHIYRISPSHVFLVNATNTMSNPTRNFCSKKSGDFPLDSRSTVKTRNFIWLGVWDYLGVANHGDVQNMLPQIQIYIISFSISLGSYLDIFPVSLMYEYFLFPSQ